MRLSHALTAVMVATALVAGCKSSEDTSGTTTATRTPAMRQSSTTSGQSMAAARSTGDSTARDANAAMTSSADSARAAGDRGAATAQDAATSARDAASSAQDAAATTAADARRAAGADTSSNTTTATGTSSTPSQSPAGQPGAASSNDPQTLLDQATQYIKENKLDMAEKSVTQLEKMKPQLPVSLQGKVESARSLLDTAKKGNSLLGGTK